MVERRGEGSDLGEREEPLGDLDGRMAAFSPSSPDFDVSHDPVIWVQLILTVDR